MSPVRWQLPVHSPITAGALGAALRTALWGGGAGGAARHRLAETLAGEFDARVVTLCGSGTDALARALGVAAARVGRDTKVALPAYTCFDLATAACTAGLPVVLYDLDPVTLGPDLDSLREALRAGALVVVVSPLYGMPVDWEGVEALAAEFGAVPIEDAAQGQGACWRGRVLGSLGPLSVLSFGRGKGWTGGAGGALLLRYPGASEEEVPRAVEAPDRKAPILAVAQWVLGRPAWYGVPASIPWLGLGETRYREPSPARELGSVSAVLLEATREAAARAAVSRRALAGELLMRLPAGGGVLPVEPLPGASPGYLRLPLRVPGGGRHLASSREARRLGIASGYPSPLAELPALRALLSGGPKSWPGAEALVRELITLPTHPLVTGADLDSLARWLVKVASPSASPRVTRRRNSVAYTRQ